MVFVFFGKSSQSFVTEDKNKCKDEDLVIFLYWSLELKSVFYC